MAASLMRVSTETGEATELLFLENQEIRKPIPSPSGAQVAFLIAKCRRCNTSLELVTVGETKTRTILRPEDFAGTQMPVWSLDEKTLYLAMERESPQSVWAADVATGKLTPLLGAAVSEPVIPTEDSTTDDSAKTDEGADDWQEDGDEDDDEDDGAEPAVTFSNIDVSPDGGRLVVTKRGNDGVYQMVEFDLKTKQVKKLVDDDGWGTKYSLDGTRIGYTTQYNTHAKDYHGDEEVAVVDLKTQKLETLTVNSRDDIFRGFSRSSKRIYYSARRYVREFSYLGRGSRATWIYWIEL
jgi:Tol biopolymer transport system component